MWHCGFYWFLHFAWLWASPTWRTAPPQSLLRSTTPCRLRWRFHAALDIGWGTSPDIIRIKLRERPRPYEPNKLGLWLGKTSCVAVTACHMIYRLINATCSCMFKESCPKNKQRQSQCAKRWDMLGWLISVRGMTYNHVILTKYDKITCAAITILVWLNLLVFLLCGPRMWDYLFSAWTFCSLVTPRHVKIVEKQLLAASKKSSCSLQFQLLRTNA